MLVPLVACGFDPAVDQAGPLKVAIIGPQLVTETGKPLSVRVVLENQGEQAISGTGGDAPQISESGHDQLIGWLDGAQTNHLRVGQPIRGDHGWSVWNIKCDDAERVPWFDFAHHDRFVLHGAGYSNRYRAGLDG